ncbi:MAG: acyl-CoA dehydrogenase family protein [SAR202 cluster bacterium]|nr:acyl-CoA dehydrogenase family protein [SAR202 cluster bacterium]
MDFAYHYTDEQQAFRDEVAAWLDSHAPDNLNGPLDGGPLDIETDSKVEGFRRDLGSKGWLAPTDSPDAGGAGLSPDHNVIILEELNRRGLLHLLEDAASALRAAIRTWGDEAQHEQYLRSIALGQTSVWRQVLPPSSDFEPASVGISAFPDADGYILDGRAMFSGPGAAPSCLWTLARVKSEDDGEPAMACFLVSPDIDSVRITTPRSLVAESVRRVFFDQVWVPRSDRLGDEDDGPSVVGARTAHTDLADLPTLLESETDALLKYTRETHANGAPLSSEPIRQQLLVEAYIASRVMRLLRMRGAWLRESGHGQGYEEAEAKLWEERASQRLSEATQESLGIYALLDGADPSAAAGGRFHRQQLRELSERSGNPSAGDMAANLGLERPGQRPAEPKKDEETEQRS